MGTGAGDRSTRCSVSLAPCVAYKKRKEKVILLIQPTPSMWFSPRT